MCGGIRWWICARTQSCSTPQFNALKPDAILLDKWHDITRYPNFLPGGAVPAELFEEPDAGRAMELAQEVLSFVKERVS